MFRTAVYRLRRMMCPRGVWVWKSCQKTFLPGIVHKFRTAFGNATHHPLPVTLPVTQQLSVASLAHRHAPDDAGSERLRKGSRRENSWTKPFVCEFRNIVVQCNLTALKMNTEDRLWRWGACTRRPLPHFKATAALRQENPLPGWMFTTFRSHAVSLPDYALSWRGSSRFGCIRAYCESRETLDGCVVGRTLMVFTW